MWTMCSSCSIEFFKQIISRRGSFAPSVVATRSLTPHRLAVLRACAADPSDYELVPRRRSRVADSPCRVTGSTSSSSHLPLTASELRHPQPQAASSTITLAASPQGLPCF
ncbi:hypothetical protein Zm00014a_016248 [Zea mays]|uniref:Uncharacterized protein n=1 Tax=Zea mays TaxID=4577 RepID=A0A317Y4Y1_MAIZE|nr:hypothetical protein Zm00014a_016248 [Zea mays]